MSSKCSHKKLQCQGNFFFSFLSMVFSVFSTWAQNVWFSKPYPLPSIVILFTGGEQLQLRRHNQTTFNDVNKKLEELLPYKRLFWIQLLVHWNKLWMFLSEARTNSKTKLRVGRILWARPGLIFFVKCSVLVFQSYVSNTVLNADTCKSVCQNWYPDFYFCCSTTVATTINQSFFVSP